MTKLISLACALLAIGLGVWSILAARQTTAVVEQARSVYLSAAAPAPAADRLQTQGRADVGQGLSDEGIRSVRPAAFPSRAAASASPSDEQEAQDASSTLPSSLKPDRPARSADPDAMGYTLPQASPALTPSSPEAPARPAAAFPR